MGWMEDKPKMASAEKFFVDFQRLDIINDAIELLKNGRSRMKGLSPSLHYHNLNHTLNVLYWSMVLAHLGNLSYTQRKLLAIAAAYHDTGYLKRRKKNEPIGVAFALDAMGKYGGYSEEDINEVTLMIASTEMVPFRDTFRQKPQSELSKFLCDADLFSFGRPDMLVYSSALMQEYGETNWTEFLKKSLKVMKAHKWHSGPAKVIFGKQKEMNMVEIRSIIKARL